ncbi:MAG: hypothetical protein IJ795_03270 [Bacteroidales bacterium]|nr:hypothetical protein [Bacteroidales bacterium]
MKLPEKLSSGTALQSRDWVVLILSLLLAFLIWLVGNLSGSYLKTVSVPVTAECQIDGYAARSAGPAVVMARCRATGYNIIRLRRIKNPVVVEFAPSDMHHRDGELFFVTASELNRYTQSVFGDNSGIETLLTDTLYFRFHKENFRKVPVSPVCTISYEAQYMSPSGIVMTPDSVLVYGEPFHIENIDRVYTRPFALAELKAPVHGEVTLETLKDVRLSQSKAEYHVDVERYVEIGETVHIRMRNVPSGKSVIVYPSTAKVVYRCSFPVLGDPAGNVDFYLDYKEFAGSIIGKCLPHDDGLPRGVLSYTIDPPVFECVESVR